MEVIYHTRTVHYYPILLVTILDYAITLLLLFIIIIAVKVSTDMMSLEHVQIRLKVSHGCRGVLQFELISPGNTRALLAEPRSHDWYGNHSNV